MHINYDKCKHKVKINTREITDFEENEINKIKYPTSL